MRPVRLGSVGIVNRILTISLPLTRVAGGEVVMRKLTLREKLRVLFGAPVAVEIKRGAKQ